MLRVLPCRLDRQGHARCCSLEGKGGGGGVVMIGYMCNTVQPCEWGALMRLDG